MTPTSLYRALESTLPTFDQAKGQSLEVVLPLFVFIKQMKYNTVVGKIQTVLHQKKKQAGYLCLRESYGVNH